MNEALKNKAMDRAVFGTCPSGAMSIHDDGKGFLLIGDIIEDFPPGVYFVRVLRQDGLSEHYMVLHTDTGSHAVLITAEQAKAAAQFITLVE